MTKLTLNKPIIVESVTSNTLSIQITKPTIERADGSTTLGPQICLLVEEQGKPDAVVNMTVAQAEMFIATLQEHCSAITNHLNNQK